MPPIIDVADLRKRYAGAKSEAVAGVSFRVEEGEVFGLLGPNGAGKTTTIGTMTTRVRPTSGSVVVDGVDVVADPVAAKLRIAVVPQRANLDRSLSALENLTFHAAYFGYGRRERNVRAREMLERFGLQGRGDDRVDNYSGGMAQRLIIARALMHDPRVLFLDEPTTGLDPQSRLFLWDQMEALKARGVTLLLTTHDMAEADRLCDRIAIVDHGKVIASDTPRGLRRVLPGAEGLEVRLEVADDPAAALGSLGEVETEPDGDGQFKARIYGADVAPGAAIAAAEAGGARVLDLRRIEGTLEDVFVHLTGRDLR
ncbi:Linearmycin resistance ATP-binding protein LnrL [Baekduia alba]|uniref:ABC transporter ATP-binding protein n=1 Tax=Baekduia alba TaxID=2997333 RepID=UPI002341EE2F|nr:ABC transporter ATP-binding protein [Baekduia alba]WCB96888.1 Linearmycin resistance ATP-binding protein LnrL [Baekduia alba]